MREITFTHEIDIENEYDSITFITNYYKWEYKIKIENMKRREYRQRGRFGRFLNSFYFKKN